MKNPISMSDQELINLYMAGNNNAMETIVYRYKDKLYAYICLTLNDRNLADDCFQEVFIKVIDNLKKRGYNDEGKFLQWMMRIAHNHCMDNFRRKKKRITVTGFPDGDAELLENFSADEVELPMVRQQKIDTVRKMIDRLPEEQREIIILRHYAELSFKEIAILVGCNLNTTLGRMRYGLLNLRKMMKEKSIAA